MTENTMNMNDFSKYNPLGSDLRNVQLSCLNILTKFKEVCEKHNLQYFLAYGTLLGAIRHGGYIPWDDDIDVWMPRPDMEKFLVECIEDMKPYVVNFYTINNNGFIKYRSQPCIEDSSYRVGICLGDKIVPGRIWIDIMPLDGMPDEIKLQKRQCRKFRIWYILIGFARSSVTGAFNPSSKKGIKKFGIILNDKLHVGKLLNVTKCLDRFERCRKQYSYEDSNYVIGTTTSYTDKAVFPKEWFSGYRELKYENQFFSVPSNTEKILEKLYGNYMAFPPEENRVGSHFQVLNYKESDNERI